MYTKLSQGWLKHLDFILLDLLCLHVAFVLAYMVRHGLHNPYAIEDYRIIAIIYTLTDLLLIIFFNTMKDVLKRGLRREFTMTLIHTLLLAVIVSFYLFSVQNAEVYSRIFYYMMLAVYFCLTLSVRLGWKVVLRKSLIHKKTVLFLIVTSKNAGQIVEDILENNHGVYQLAGMAILDRDLRGSEIGGVPVVSCQEDVEEYLKREWVDEVLIAVPNRAIGSADPPYMREDSALSAGQGTAQRAERDFGQSLDSLYQRLIDMGLVVHIKLEGLKLYAEQRQTIEHIGNSTVLTYSLGSVTLGQAFAKRAMDILGGLVGCILTGILCIVIGPMIFFNSPGSIFFSQTRVGRNGKKFMMYKFRSMCLDAEARKAEVAVACGLDGQMMFKFEEDPRIIGSRILPDGTYKKGIGNFIRDWSLDEFPQFFNVLKGDMSLVGTRPPTVDEWEKYEAHHRVRMSIRPGITGLWQVSGRSRISDFEEVVELDRQYICDWSLWLDLKILMRTVCVVFRRDGAM